MIPWFESPFAQRLAWTLLHFLWQGALLGLAAWLTFTLLRRRSPQVRYLLGCAFLLACMGSAAATLALLAPPAPFADQAPGSVQATLRPKSLAAPSQPVEATSLPAPIPWQSRLHPFLPWILAAWAAGVLCLSLRAAGGWLWLRRLKAAAKPVSEPEWLKDLVRRTGLRRAVRFLESVRVTTPMCLGLLRPVILLPLGFLANLDPLAAEAVLAHELAHLRRLDGLVNGLQCVIEVLFFFHPAVWWISRRIRTEREHCCDDAAVLACGDAVFYAETLSRLDDLRERPSSLALSARGGNLMERMRRLLISDPPQLRFSTPSLALMAALALVTTLPAQTEKPKTPPPMPETSAPTPPRLAPNKPATDLPIAIAPPPGPATGALALASRMAPALELPGAPGPIATPPPLSTAQAPPARTTNPEQGPERGSQPPAPPTEIPLFDAKSLRILPGDGARTLEVPQCPAIIRDELLTWPAKTYAVMVPANTLVRAQVRSESGEAYFKIRVMNKWGQQIKGMPGDQEAQGRPETSFANTSSQPMPAYFVVTAALGYPGNGKISLHLTRHPMGRRPEQEAPSSQRTPSSPPFPNRPAPFAGAEPTWEEARPIIQSFAERRPWGDGYGVAIAQVKVFAKERWNDAYLGQWPEAPEKKSFLRTIKHIEGWVVTFQVQGPMNRPVTLTVLLDKDGVIHWRRTWPTLPPGLESLGSHS